jgi:hypothetical protein
MTMHGIHPTPHGPAYGYHHNPMQAQHAPSSTGYDYGSGTFTGTNGLVTSSHPAWPAPATSGETMTKINAWLDKAPMPTSYPKVKNKHLAIGAAVVAAGGLAWYGSKHRWF